MDEAVRARNIWKRFGKSVALEGVSFDVPRGSVYCIAGPNGSGKTTLLSIIAGAMQADSGEIGVSGRVGYCYQTPLLYPDLTVSQNLELFSDMLGAGGSKEGAIGVLGLGEVLGKKVIELSSGTKKRVELGAAMLSDPDILILDEPTTGLDRKNTEGILGFIRGIAGKKTVILATHQLSDMGGLCTHLLVLKKGKKAYDKRVRAKDLERLYSRIP